MASQPYFPPTSPGMHEASLLKTVRDFKISAAPKVEAPDCITDKSPMAQRMAYYEAWVEDELKTPKPSLGM